MKMAAAEARHRAYALFGRVFVQGLTEEVRETLLALPAVADSLPDPFDPDLAAAAHHEAVGRLVFPYESAFRSDDGLLGGAVGAEVHEAYRSGGFRPDTHSLEPDHIGLQCAYLAHLARAEAEALEDEQGEAVLRCQQHATDFLEAHALRWWPSFAAALATQTSNAWMARVAALAAELAAGHRAASVDDDPAGGLDLDDPETGLRQIVDHLVRPARSGWFLSLEGMARAAQQADLPSGFGTRAKQLESLWHTAADHHAVPRLAEALIAEVERYAAVLAELGGSTARLDATTTMLRRVATHAARVR